jgi:hypothetical protein
MLSVGVCLQMGCFVLQTRLKKRVGVPLITGVGLFVASFLFFDYKKQKSFPLQSLTQRGKN